MNLPEGGGGGRPIGVGEKTCTSAQAAKNRDPFWLIGVHPKPACPWSKSEVFSRTYGRASCVHSAARTCISPLFLLKKSSIYRAYTSETPMSAENSNKLPTSAIFSPYPNTPPHDFWPHPGAEGYTYLVPRELNIPRSLTLPPTICAFCDQRPRGRNNGDLTALRGLPKGWALQYVPPARAASPHVLLWRCHKHLNTAEIHAVRVHWPQ